MVARALSFALWIGLSGGTSIAGAAAPPARAPADYVFRNGAVYTVDSRRPWAQAVAVRGRHIAYVGDESGLGRWIGRHTRIVDLKHGMLLPGFVDSHSHLSSLATLFDPALTLRGQPPAAVLDALRRFVAAHPEETMIRGGDWIVESFPPAGPDKTMLDPILPDKPAVLMSIDGHFMWVNSKTLELAGITPDTSDPEPGVSWFQRYPGTREPSGFVVEGQAMSVVLTALEKQGFPYETRARLEEGFDQGLPILAAAGITTIFDAASRDEAAFYAILHRLELEHRLPVRVFGAHALSDGLKPGQNAVQEFQALRRTYHSDLLSAQMIKVFLDGSENNHTGYMLEPYADRADTRGEPLWPQGALDDLLTAADAAGIDLHMHVVGDAAARMGLDAVEHASQVNGPRDRRHTLAHVVFVDPDDIARFRALGVLWQTTPAWAQMSPRNVTVLQAVGDRRFAERSYRLRDALDQGVTLTFGADFDTVNQGAIFKPLEQMEIAHTRRPLNRPDVEPMPNADQRIGVAELIRCYTIAGAIMLHLENKVGSIEVGKYADLVVLGRNLFDVPPSEIHATPIELTMMAGRVTYLHRR